MLKKLARAIFCALALNGVAAPVAAVPIQAVFTGTVYGSFDKTGLFGGAGGSLDGQAFTMTFKYDTALGQRSNAGPSTYDNVIGSTRFGLSNPTISATLQIGSQSRSILGDYFSQYQMCDDGYPLYCGVDQYYANAEDYLTQPGGSYTLNRFVINFWDYLEFLPDNLDTPFSMLVSGSVGQDSRFIFASYDAALGTYPVYTYGGLTVSSLTVGPVVPPVAPVPLPAAGGALLAALAAIGVLRGRRPRLTT